MADYQYVTHDYDVVVVGAGGASLRATLGTAQGGIAASLPNMGPDNWQWHMYDTVKGSDWLGDHRRHGISGARGPGPSMSWNITACRFSRTERRWQIYQRPSAATTEFGEGPPVQRTCAAADRTGHAILHTLYGQSLKEKAEFFIEYFALT